MQFWTKIESLEGENIDDAEKLQKLGAHFEKYPIRHAVFKKEPLACEECFKIAKEFFIFKIEGAMDELSIIFRERAKRRMRKNLNL